MPVKSIQSGERMLTVLEKIAEYQPIGITELARLMHTDISAMQRALATLARTGWIRVAANKAKSWELTPRIQSVAQLAQGGEDLRRRAHPVLQVLRDETNETASLNVLERGQLITTEVQESRRYLRVVVPEGLVVPPHGSATGRAILPYMSAERQIELLGRTPDAAERKEYAATLARGYAISSGVLYAGFTNLAAPVFEADGRPVAAVVLAGPSDRLLPEHFAALGASVVAAAQKVSRGSASPLSRETEEPPKRPARRAGRRS
jgi:IclR family acetate operon transcriptional repressor